MGQSVQKNARWDSAALRSSEGPQSLRFNISLTKARRQIKRSVDERENIEENYPRINLKPTKKRPLSFHAGILSWDSTGGAAELGQYTEPP
jgi:hypothetical protein